jgi:hypothetical protein
MTITFVDNTQKKSYIFIMTLNEKQLRKIKITLEIFRSQIGLYNKLKDDEQSLDEFMSLNRNPFFDLTTNKFFKTGLVSNEVKRLNLTSKNVVHDHFIQRKKSMKLFFDLLIQNPNMDVNQFIDFMKKYVSTVGLTKEEHMKVTMLAKNNDEYNFNLYTECDIIIDGMDKFVI